MRNTDLQRLCEDMERIATAAEHLLRATSGAASISAQADACEEHRGADHVRPTTASTTRDRWRSNPWQTLGIATGIGLLIGCMLSRPQPGK